jgi:hypothetical protein
MIVAFRACYGLTDADAMAGARDHGIRGENEEVRGEDFFLELQMGNRM